MTVRLSALIVALVGVFDVDAAAADRVAVRIVGGLPTEVRAGTPWTATISVTRARRPMARARVLLVARSPGRTLSIRARELRAGRYRAVFVFPVAARWSLTARLAGRSYGLGSIRVTSTLQLRDPFSIAAAPDGSVFVANGRAHEILRVSAASAITRAAGNGQDGASGDGGPATSARVGFPISVAVAADGDFYVVSAHRIRRVDAATGLISTVAGRGEDGHTGDGGPATQALLQGATAVAVDQHENLYITEYGGYVRRVDADSGVITTIAGVGREEWSGDGGPATRAGIDRPHGLAVAADGSVYVSDTYSARLRRIDPNGIITTVLGPDVLEIPVGVAVGPDGSVYVTSHGGNDRVLRLAPGGQVSNAVPIPIDDPAGVDLDEDGNLFVSELTRPRLLRIDAATGRVTTLAGR